MKPPENLIDWAQAALWFIVSLAMSLAFRQFILRSLTKYKSRVGQAGRILHESLRWPSLLWCVAGALALTLEYAGFPGNTAKYASGATIVFLVVSICVVTSSLMIRLMDVAARERGLVVAVSGVVRALIHVFVLLIGMTVVMRYFKISITPVLTALGVGGLAVALALRDTLANFFAGIHIVLEAPVSIGDFIKLSSGEEGTVSDIGWRTTRVLMTNNNMIVIPNERITSSILTNYALPDARVVVDVAVLIHLEADAHRAMEIALEVAAENEVAIREFTPVVMFDPGVTPTHIQFKVIVQVANRLQQGPVQSSLRLAIWDRFRREGIRLPEPARGV